MSNLKCQSVLPARHNAYRPEIRPLKILVKLMGEQFQVEVVGSVDEAQRLCRKMGGISWDYIGWGKYPVES